MRGLCGAPSAFGLSPARQPTAARTAPPPWPAGSLALTTTSVTMLAKKQVGFVVSVHVVGSTTLTKLLPVSVER